MSSDALEIIDTEQLPPQMRGLVRVIGLEETYKLLRHRGGTRVRIGSDPDSARSLKAVISQDALEKLTAIYPGQRIELPKIDKMLLAIRNHAIRAERAEGTSIDQLALQWGLSRRQVINICSDVEPDQGDLFEEAS